MNERETDAEKKAFFEQLYLENYRKVSAYALHVSCNAAVAEDVVQDTFYEALRKLEELAVHPNVPGWLMTTARYKLYCRMKRHYNLDKPAPEEWESQMGKMEGAYGMAELKMVADKIFNSHEWQMFRQYYLERYPAKELAVLEGISEDTFKMRMHRMKLKLRRELT